MVAGFAKLELRPNDRLDMALSLQGDYVNQGGFPYRLLDVQTRKPLALSADSPETYERHTATARFLIGYRLSEGLQLQSVLSYQYLYDRAQLDMDASSMHLFMADQRLREHGFTQEFILKGLTSEGAKYRWSAGLFGYYDAKKIDVPVTYSPRGASLLIAQGIAQMKRQIAARNPQAAARIPAYQYVPRPGGAPLHRARRGVAALHFRLGGHGQDLVSLIQPLVALARLHFHGAARLGQQGDADGDRKSTRLNSVTRQSRMPSSA